MSFIKFLFQYLAKNWFGLHGFSVRYPPILNQELTLVCGIVAVIYSMCKLIYYLTETEKPKESFWTLADFRTNCVE